MRQPHVLVGLLAVLAADVENARLVVGSVGRVLHALITPSSATSWDKGNHAQLR